MAEDWILGDVMLVKCDFVTLHINPSLRLPEDNVLFLFLHKLSANLFQAPMPGVHEEEVPKAARPGLGENALLVRDKPGRKDVDVVDEPVGGTCSESIDTWASCHHSGLSKTTGCLCYIWGTPSLTNPAAACLRSGS